MNKRVLITGGLGYVGGRIAQYLAADSSLSLRLTSRRADTPKPDWLNDGEIVQWDIAQDDSVICAGVDAVIHLAALNEIDCAQDALAALQVNGMGTLRLLQAAQSAGVRRFIYFSTAHVYGAPLAGSISEQTVPRPIHPYAITHKVAEDFVLAARDLGKIDSIVLRLSNGFGAPIATDVNRWTLLVNDLCRQAVSTGKLVLRSSGLQQRDFITLQDAARCVAHFMALPKADCRDGLFNLGGECSRSIFAMTQLVAFRCQAVLGFTPPIERVEPQLGEQAAALDYSIAKLKTTGFALQSRFEDEIDATLSLCQQAFRKN
ncbi:MAG: UDP-glucose 4-epimerase [Comamonadaceae bacterium CG12_big_fil_rev_8_21_14_0_65_59_15]|nr:MAG: UDP-glucose 4-epimerase [Comamonadaceae bacterium CG12_big_fil_rev_8_21_14_0_65_59_15]